MTECVEIRHGNLCDRIVRAQNQLQSLSVVTKPAERRRIIERLDGAVASLTRDFKSLQSEVRTLSPEHTNIWRAKIRTTHDTLKNITREITWAKSEIADAKASATTLDVSPTTDESALIQYGRTVMVETTSAGDNAITMIEMTKTVGQQTATKLKTQTDQMKRVHDQAYEIESNVDRSIFLMKRMGRRVATDKLIWLLTFLILVAVIFILCWKFFYVPKMHHATQSA